MASAALPQDFAVASTPRRGFMAFATKGMLLLTMLVCVTVPHAFQVPTAALILATVLLSSLTLVRSAWLDKLLLTYYAGVVVTAFYLWVGYVNGAPQDAILQITVVNILSPLIWLLLAASLMQYFGIERTIQWLLRFNWLALLTVPIFFYLFLTRGKQAVAFLAEDANVNVTNGFSGATMLVYGSLIFLSGAFFAEPLVMRSRIARLVFPVALILVALTSGRSALIISIPIGYLVGLVMRSRLAVAQTARATRGSWLLPTLVIVVAGGGALFAITALFPTIELDVIISGFVNKIWSGGGDVRTEQADALWAGVEQSYGLGHGLGVGVPYLRSELYPWRYELIPLASLLRVGFFGTLVYCSTFLVYAALLIQRFSQRQLAREDIYMAGGFIAAAVAAATNPYIESFIFQWMFFIPVVSLGVSEVRRTRYVPLGAAA